MKRASLIAALCLLVLPVLGMADSIVWTSYPYVGVPTTDKIVVNLNAPAGNYTVSTPFGMGLLTTTGVGTPSNSGLVGVWGDTGAINFTGDNGDSNITS